MSIQYTVLYMSICATFAIVSSKETIENLKKLSQSLFPNPQECLLFPLSIYIFLVLPDRICMRDREIISLAALPTPSQCKYLYFLTFSLLAGQLCIVLPLFRKLFYLFFSLLIRFWPCLQEYTVGLLVTFDMRCTIFLIISI